MLSLSCLLMISVNTITIGNNGLPIFCLRKMFHVKHFRLRSLLSRRKEVLLVLQKALLALVNFLCEFVIGHPRIICSILGCLAAAALIACVAAINILWR